MGFPPFPTSAICEHVSGPVAQQFYRGSLLVTELMMYAMRWYIDSGRRMVSPNLSPRENRRHHLISAGVPASFVVLIVLMALGVERFVNPLLLTYLVAFGGVVLGVVEGRDSLPVEVEQPGAANQARPQGEEASE